MVCRFWHLSNIGQHLSHIVPTFIRHIFFVGYAYNDLLHQMIRTQQINIFYVWKKCKINQGGNVKSFYNVWVQNKCRINKINSTFKWSQEQNDLFSLNIQPYLQFLILLKTKQTEWNILKNDHMFPLTVINFFARL